MVCKTCQKYVFEFFTLYGSKCNNDENKIMSNYCFDASKQEYLGIIEAQNIGGNSMLNYEMIGETN